MIDLLTKTRKINKLLQQKSTFDMQVDLPYDKIAVTLGSVLDSNTYIISNDGILLGYHECLDIRNDRVKKMLIEKRCPDAYTETVNQVNKTETNISIASNITSFHFDTRDKYSFGLTTVVPIFVASERLGTIILARMEHVFKDKDLVLAEYGATVLGMQILYQKSRNIESDIRNTTAVQMAINTLSYSELKAVQTIFQVLEGQEGRLTASNIADKIGITRSVIVNALRKLESAGIIESRSLGMKGTYLKVLNSRFKEELTKYHY